MRDRCIMMQLKMRKSAANERREIALLFSVTPNQFAYGENPFPRCGKINRPNQTIEPAGEQGDAVFRRFDWHLRRLWHVPASDKPDQPAISCQIREQAGNRVGLGIPEFGIDHGNRQIEFSRPAIRAFVAVSSQVCGDSRHSDR